VPAGASRTVELLGSTRPLQRWTDAGFVPAAAEALVTAAAHAGDRGGPAARLALR
jgi:hypothetical protein